MFAALNNDVLACTAEWLAAQCVLRARRVCRQWNRALTRPRIEQHWARSIFGVCLERGRRAPVAHGFPMLQPGTEPSLAAFSLRSVDLFAGYRSINARMRLILHDWLFDVQRYLKLQDVELGSAMSLSDRFLRCVEPHRARLQLVGACALWMTSSGTRSRSRKPLTAFTDVCDNAYSAKEFVAMRHAIVSTLSTPLCPPRRRRCQVVRPLCRNSPIYRFLYDLSFLSMRCATAAVCTVHRALQIIARRMRNADRSLDPRLVLMDAPLRAVVCDVLDMLTQTKYRAVHKKHRVEVWYDAAAQRSAQYSLRLRFTQSFYQ